MSLKTTWIRRIILANSSWTLFPLFYNMEKCVKYGDIMQIWHLGECNINFILKCFSVKFKFKLNFVESHTLLGSFCIKKHAR